MKYFYVCVYLMVVLLSGFQTKAATFMVANGDVAGLRNAITMANNSRADDIIVLATNGTYDITAAIRIADDYGTPAGGIAFPMLDARDFSGTLTIQGNGATIRRAANATGKFRFLFCRNNVTLIIENLTFRDADADSGGGAIFLGYRNVASFKNVKFINNITSGGIGGAISSKSLNSTTIEDCEFTGNRARNIGGAIYHLFSDLTVINSKFTDNATTNANNAEGGGAIFADGGKGDKGKITITQSTFSKNTSYADGCIGIFLYNTNTGIIDRCEFSENKSLRSTRSGLGFGGAVRYDQGKIGAVDDGFTAGSPLATSLDITNSTFFKNSAFDQGGGLWLSDGTVNITNCTIVGNSLEDGSGAGIKISGATVNMVNCTVAENSITNAFCAGVDNFKGKFNYRNSLFVNNINTRTGQENYREIEGGTSSNQGNNMVFNTNNTANNGGLPAAVTRANPLLSPLANNGGSTRTMALQMGSPAIGAGANCPTTDQRGIARTGRCDIGAFHFNMASATPPSAPSGLTAEAQSATQIRLNWADNSTNETGFKVERSATAGSGYAEITQVGAGITTFTDNNLTAGTRYFYRVRASNAQGNSDYSNEANATTNILPPTPPSGLTAEAQSVNQIRLNWADNSANETGFKVERSASAGSGYAEITQVGAGITTFTDNNLPAGTRYFYRVRAFNAQGNSDYSNEASTIVGITYIDVSNQLKVFPNPTEERLSVQIDNQYQGYINVRIIDMVGKTLIQEVWQKYINKLSKEMNVSNLPNGIFILEINYENYRAIKRVIKQ